MRYLKYIVFLFFLMFITTPVFGAGCDSDLCYAVYTGGATTGDCPVGTPCTLVYAVETVADSGDTVSLNDGTYTLADDLSVPVGVSITSTSTDKTLVIIKPSADITEGHAMLELYSTAGTQTGNQTISYITFEGTDGSNKAHRGIIVKNRDDVQITQNTFQNFSGTAVDNTYTNAIFVLGTTIGDPNPYPPIDYQDLWPADSQEPGTDTNINALWPLNPVVNLEIDNNLFTSCGWKATGNAVSPAIRLHHLKTSSIHDNTLNNAGMAAGYAGQFITGSGGLAVFENVDIYNNSITMGSSYTDRSTYPIEIWVLRGDGTGADGSGCDIYNNTSDAGFSIIWGKETKVYDNTIIATDANYRGIGIEFIEQSYGLLDNNFISLSPDSAYTNHGITIGAGGAGQKNWLNEHNIIRNQVIYNPSNAAIEIMSKGHISAGGNTNTVDHIYMYNNTAKSSDAQFYGAKIFEDDQAGAAVLSNVNVKNNVIMEAASYGIWTSGTVSPICSDYNDLYDNGTAGDNFAQDGNSIELDPTYADPTFDEYDDATPTANVINAGTSLTLTNDTGGGSGTSLVLDDVGYFRAGDFIWIDNTVADDFSPSLISSINYTTNTITLFASSEWDDDAPVHLADSGSSGYNGAGRDIGAIETGSASDTTPPVISSPDPYDGEQLAVDTTTYPVLITATDTTGVTGCKADTDGSEAYADMANAMSDEAGDTWGYTYNPPMANGGEYTLYFRCIDDGGYANLSDYSITFTVTPGASGTIIIDNADAGFSTNGAWSVASREDAYNGGHAYDNTGAADADTVYAVWTPTIPIAGDYKVYMWWITTGTLPDAAPVIITHSGGTANITVDQTSGGGAWVELGTWNFAVGAGGNVKITGEDAGYTIADAVKFELVTPGSPTIEGGGTGFSKGGGTGFVYGR